MGSKTADDLFPGILNDSHVLVKETNVKELMIIAMELRYLTGRVWQSTNMLKSEQVNAIVKAFGGNVFLPIVWKEKKTQNPENLVQICTNFIKGAHFLLNIFKYH